MSFIVGTIGELHKNKGYEYLIGAAREVQNATFVIIGEGEERKKLEALIEKNDLKNRVFLLGYIPDATDYLNAFDIFVLPSLKEGLPYVILEAGLQGLPVVASSVGGIPDFIEHEKTGLLVPAKDANALTTVIHLLIENETLRRSLGPTLREKTKTRFSFRFMLERTISLY